MVRFLSKYIRINHTLLKYYICVFCLQISLAVIARYLSTSMVNASLGEPPIGWLVPYVRSKNRRKTDDEDESELEEVETEA